MRIRKKLIFLHTVFSLALAGILWLALRPALHEIVTRAEEHESAVVLEVMLAGAREGESPAEVAAREAERLAREAGRQDGGGARDVSIWIGGSEEMGLTAHATERAREQSGRVTRIAPEEAMAAAGEALPWPRALVHDAASDRFVGVSVRAAGARAAVVRLYVLLTLTLLAVYGLIAAALEIFVLPQHVYGPIRAILHADSAVQEGREDAELIPDADMPADEIGEIMRSRNEAILSIRAHEHALADALGRLETVATDLKRKNHLIEMARRNMAETDRLASLGMMSAGLAHEMNTPLAVLKGLTEKLNSNGGQGMSEDEAALMRRVVERLERLSESLLDFARVRPPASAPTPIRAVAQEAWTLVRLDREPEVEMTNDIPHSLIVPCDADRMVQVFVNLLRNSVEAMSEHPLLHERSPRRITVAADHTERDGQQFASITITDNGPGIDPDMLSTLFEPFVSTRMDSRGTGLGLAVAEGIVREHSGVLLARNRQDGSGAVFEIVLPMAVISNTEDAERNAEGGEEGN